jgi:hypothetical protein
MHATNVRLIGRLFFAMVIFAAGFSLGLFFYTQEKTKSSDAQEPAKWETNWPQLKQGMTKEAVLTLVGAPSSTTVREMKTTNVSVNSSNPNALQNATQTAAKLDQKFSGAIWCYYEAMVIHTTPGEDAQTAFGQAAKQIIAATNLETALSGKLQGHAIKFDGSGHVIEISAE